MAWMVPIMAAEAQKREEDELLAALIAKDTDNAYEFKILRSAGGAFRNNERLRAILDEERQAQWEMVMKLDNQRIVLRRPRRTWAYSAPEATGVDPYRTEIGASAASIYVGLTLALLVGGVGVFIWMGAGRPNLLDARFWSILMSMLTVLVLILIIKIKRR